MAARAGLSSLHLTFCTKEECEIGTSVGLLPRLTQQFHWFNQGYRTYDDFLAQLASRKRKAIRKERAQAQAFGGTIRRLTGDDLRPAHWDAFWAFYQDTGARKWGQPYLTRSFFDLIHQTMRNDVLLVLAERDGRAVAGALNFIGARHALRPLLGLHRGSSRPAFRMLLSSGDRSCDRAWTSECRSGGAGRT